MKEKISLALIALLIAGLFVGLVLGLSSIVNWNKISLRDSKLRQYEFCAEAEVSYETCYALIE